MSLSRLASLLVALAYLQVVGWDRALHLARFLFFPLSAIWFPEFLGGFTGRFGNSYIGEESPAFLVAFMGWVLLLVPVIGWVVVNLLG